MKIDLVYLWVDGDDPVWRGRREAYLHGVDQSDTESFCAARTANSDELRYSLRSVDMYASWINHIFVVVDNQCPEWLDKQNPNISVVDLRDIFTPEELPLYNSCAIEQGIHRIKTLSEHYIYANDDMMFGKKTTPQIFFTQEGLAKSYFVKNKNVSKASALKNTYNYTIKKVIDTITRDFDLRCGDWTPHHQIDAYRKSSVEGCVERYKTWSEATIANRFRTKEDMQRHIFSLYAVAVGDAVAVVNNQPKVFSVKTLWQAMCGGVESLCLQIHKKHIRGKMRLLRPSLLCFNDTPRTTNEDRVALKALLEELYPSKSQFEK